MNPLFHTDCSISDSLKSVRKSVLIYETIILVLGAKFETIDYRKIPEEMYFLDKEIKTLMDEYEELPLSKYVERVIQIHHRMTVIHAFRDGNGRTTRALANMVPLEMKRAWQQSLKFFQRQIKIESFMRTISFANKMGYTTINDN